MISTPSSNRSSTNVFVTGATEPGSQKAPHSVASVEQTYFTITTDRRLSNGEQSSAVESPRSQNSENRIFQRCTLQSCVLPLAIFLAASIALVINATTCNTCSKREKIGYSLGGIVGICSIGVPTIVFLKNRCCTVQHIPIAQNNEAEDC